MKDFFKKLFPKPRIPQKRYIVLIIFLYSVAKIYTNSTATPIDDQILEHAKDVAVNMVT